MRSFRDYAESPVNWSRAAHFAVGLVFIFAVCRWFAK